MSELRKWLGKISHHFLPLIPLEKAGEIIGSTTIVDDGKDPLLAGEAAFQEKKYGRAFEFNNGHLKFTQNFYQARFRDVFVEPKHQIVIKGYSGMVRESAFYDWYRFAKGHYLKARLFRPGRIRRISKGILFDGSVGLNYFHFYNDVLPKLSQVDELDPDQQFELIISERLFHTAYFQFFYQDKSLQKYNWLVQKQDEYIHADELLMIKTRQFHPQALRRTAAAGLALAKDSISRTGEKIFINRKPGAGRHVSNFDQLKPVLGEFGYKILYMDEYPVEQQIAMCRDAKKIVGVHGAGLTNILFADPSKARVLEIFPKGFEPTHYYWLSNALQIRYNACYGNELTGGSFIIDPQYLRAALSDIEVREGNT
ncbi:MAG: hypothetical protein JWQ27_171 [Ferruginibacter sp.]|nr:hypothetical protein [Ferruginibacter sp.]